MERFLVFLCIFCLLFTSAIAYHQPDSLRYFGSEMLRGYEKLRLQLETSRWPTLEGEHFIVKYRSGDEASAYLVLQEAERVYRPLGEFFGYFPGQQVPIAIYPDRASLNRVFGWGKEESAMGVYWSGVLRVLTPQAWLGELPGADQAAAFKEQGPVAHEYIHLLVDYKTKGNYTRWLTEGLAQYGEEQIAGVRAPARELPPFTMSLEELDRKFDDPAWQDYCYSVAKDLVEYLVKMYGADHIPVLLNALEQGKSTDEAFRDALGCGIEEVLQGYRGFPSAE